MPVVLLPKAEGYQPLYDLAGFTPEDSGIITIGNSTVTGVFNTVWEERPSGLVTP